MTLEIPRLCGGTFFVLLLNSKRQRAKKDIQNFGSNGVTNPELLKHLILLFDPTFITPVGSSMDTNTSQYKKCEIKNADCLPFNDAALINDFDKKIKSEYNNILREMKQLTDFFIPVEKEPKINELVFGILNLIKEDTSIKPENTFYALPTGKTISKRKLLTLSEINLYSLLLGTWHFILVNRPDNEIGKATIKSWHDTPELKGTKHQFISKISDSYSLDIKVNINFEEIDSSHTNKITESSDSFSNDGDVEADIVDAVIIDKEPKHKNTESPTIHNQYIINQNGNGVNIAQANKVIIKNGKVVEAE